MNRLGRRCLGAVLASALLSACASLEFRETPTEVVLHSPKVVLPVHWWGTYALVEVTLDGEGPYTFILDTGASVLMVSPEIAAHHPGGAPSFEEPIPVQESSSRSTVATAAIRVDSLLLGGAEFHGVDAIVLDTGFLSDTLGFRVDGILGISVFANGLLTIDFPAKEIWFSQGELGPVDGLSILPLEMEGCPWIHLVWGGNPIRVMLDSGSNGGIDLEEWPPDSDFLSGPLNARLRGSLSGLAGEGTFARVRGTLVLGRFKINDPVICRGAGLQQVGMEVLGDLCFTVDCAHGKIRFEGSTVDLTMDSVRGTGAAVIPSKGLFSVLGILPGFPAEKAGLRVSDLVVRVDGTPADAKHELEVLDLLHREGHVVHLDVRRDGKDLEFEVPIVDIVH